MPAASWRMKPALTKSWWLGISASAGASRSVWPNSWDKRILNLLVRFLGKPINLTVVSMGNNVIRPLVGFQSRGRLWAKGVPLPAESLEPESLERLPRGRGRGSRRARADESDHGKKFTIGLFP